MSDENLVISLKDHATNASNTFKMLWNDQDFADVTLATMDNLQVRVHKVIISACSPLLKRILIKNPHPNPLVYLKGVRFKELEKIISFIYLGQCEVKQSELANFLATGKDLEVMLDIENIEHNLDQVLTSGNVSKEFHNTEENSLENQPAIEKISPAKPPATNVSNPLYVTFNKPVTRGSLSINKKGKIEQNISVNKNVSICGKSSSNDSQIGVNDSFGNTIGAIAIIEEGNIEKNLSAKENLLPDGTYSSKDSHIGVHDSSSNNIGASEEGNIEQQIETEDNVILYEQTLEVSKSKMFCDICDQDFVSKITLFFHKQSVHGGLYKYKCETCKYKCSSKKKLIAHKKSITHKKLITNKKLITSEKLTTHNKYITHTKSKRKVGKEKEINSEIIFYDCSECEFKASRTSTLTQHKIKLHGAGGNPDIFCDKCTYSTHFEKNLVYHIRVRHEGIIYECEKCSYSGSTKSHLRAHIDFKHNGIRPKCNLCDFQSTPAKSVFAHKKEIHFMTKYHCDMCDYHSYNSGHVKNHKKTIHFKVRYPCNLCDHQATQPHHLATHINRQHRA